MTAHTAAPADAATIETLSRRFAETFETQAAPPDLFTDDVLFDLNVPVWRFQLQGRDAWATQLQHIVQGDVRIHVRQTVPTAAGFVAEHEEEQVVDGELLTARRLWICRVQEGRIAEVTGYCSGEWNAALRERQAREAPMIRP